MVRLDRIASLVVLACGALLMFGALRMELGSPGQPGMGFLPVGTAGLMIALSIAYAVSSFRQAIPPGEESPWPRQARARLIVVVASLALFCALLPVAGYVLSTFALMVALFLVAEPGRWLAAIFKSALSTAVTYLVFAKLLMIQFPAGFFGN